jgi:guanine nucleotide-binding protein subunit alpha
VLFENIVNSKWFIKCSVILLLNKADLFARKLCYSPLSEYFPEYAGGDDYAKACKFILWRFQQVNRANLPIFPHVTSVVEATQGN